MYNGRLTGKIVFITGGSSGIGKGAVTSCCEEGAKTIFVDTDETRGRELEALMLKSGYDCIYLNGDVTKEDNWVKLAKLIAEKFSRVDVLVNNAGTNVIKPVTEMLEADWDKVLSLNLKSVFLGVKHMIPLMINNGGSIINIASSYGIIGRNNMSAYCASKGGVISLTRELSLEYAKRGIRVNSISPGPTLTEMLQRNMDNGLTDRTKLLSSVPIERFATPHEIGSLVIFLASDESAFITGSNMIIDGGQTIV